jgi:hypothetical protein
MNTARLEWAGGTDLEKLIDSLKDAADLIYCAKYAPDVGPVDCLVIGSDDEEIAEIFAHRAQQLAQGCFIIVTDVHASGNRKMKWESLCTDSRVNLSLDLWHLGLLFYRPDFKEKQHFVLKHHP